MLKLTDIARCECSCREVRFRAVGACAGILSGQVVATLNHSDVDCNNASGVQIVTPFTRHFPIFDAECNIAPPVVIAVHALPVGGGWSHIGWQVSENGQLVDLQGFGPLNLQPETLGGPITVTALFSRCAEDQPGVEQCSTQLLIPAHVELTLPSTLDFSDFDDFIGSAPYGCPTNEAISLNPIWRSADLFNRLGTSPIVLRCFHTFGGRGPGNFVSGASPVTAEYRYSQAAGVCARLWLEAQWITQASGALRALARCTVELYLVDKAVVPAAGEDALSLRQRVGFERWKWISGEVSIATLRALLADQDEHQSPACGTSEGGSLPCVVDGPGGWAPPVSPLQVYEAGSLLDLLGESESWTAFADFFLRHGGVVNPCSASSGDPNIFAAELIDPNVSFPIEVAGVAPGENSPGDCLCLDLTDIDSPTGGEGSAGVNNQFTPRSANTYLANGQTLDDEACELVCVVNGPEAGNPEYSVECFPKRVRLWLPSTLNFSAYRAADCNSLGGGGAFAESIVGDGPTYRSAHLRDTYVLGGHCDRLAASAASGSLPTIWNPFQFGSLTHTMVYHAFRMMYEVMVDGACFPDYELELACGHITSAGKEEAAGLSRLFTQARLRVRLANTSNVQLDLYAVNLGPEFNRSSVAAEDVRTYTQISNYFGWVHNWAFGSFCHNDVPPGNYGTDCFSGPTPPSPPSDWFCPYSYLLNYWLASTAIKDTGELIGDLCLDCEEDAVEENWEQFCFTHRTHVVHAVRLQPTFDPVDEVVCDDEAENFIRYQA